jgi:hypothetical protein
VAVQDGSLCFLFENKGLMYDRKGFKMLAALNQHCCPNSVANAFTTLMLLFNNSMGELEEIMAFWSRFDGMVNNMSCCKIILSPGLMVVFFLCSLHSRYNDLLQQVCSCYKSLEGASLDSIVAGVRCHDEFKLVGSDKKVQAGKGPKAAAAAASSAVDKQGKEWRNPYEWLASFDIIGVKQRWTRSLAGNGFCPICHLNKDKHALTACPLLAELNLKLIQVSPPAGPPAAVPAPAASPSSGGRSAMADEESTSGLMGFATAPSGLVATVAEEYDSDNNICWDSDESGAKFSVFSALTKSNNDVAFYYPLCKHVVVESSPPPLVPPPLCCANMPLILPAASSSKCIVICKHLTSIIKHMSAALILPTSGRHFTVADSGATNHMFPNKSAFISYRLVTNLQVRMGNNSFLPVLGCGLVVISLNGQHVLVRNAHHVPGLVILLYSLCAHFAQPGCGFISASSVGILVYFPTFILSVDTLKDCYLAFVSLGCSASLDTLHYIQPCCAPSLYPSELASHTASKSPAVIEDDSSVLGVSDKLI